MTFKRKTWITLLLVLALVAALGSIAVFAEEPEPEQSESLPVETAAEEAPAGEETEPEQTGEVTEPEQPESPAEETPLDGGGKVFEMSFYAYNQDTGAYEEVYMAQITEGKKIGDVVSSSMPAGEHWLAFDPADKNAEPVSCTRDEILAYTPTMSIDFKQACLVSYKDESGATTYGTECVLVGGHPKGLSVSGVTNWTTAAHSIVYVPKQVITEDTVFTAWVSPGLNSAHVSYISGVTEYKFAPSNNLTRGQAAIILYKLLADQSMGSFPSSFADVPDGKSYSEAVRVLASRGIITGKSATTFAPNDNVTRGDFVLMISRLFELKEGTWTYTDGKESDYFRDAVAVATANGWITGYSDGSFKGRAHITRAEAVTLINRVLGRTPDKNAIDALGHRKFIDVDDNTNWAYYQIMEAAIGADGKLPAFTTLKSGWQNIEGKIYYVDSTLSFEVFKPGLRTEGGKTFYVNAIVNVAGITKYNAGVAKFSDGKLYLVKSDGSITTSKPSNYETSVLEYGGHMYYLQSDYSLLANGYYGALYFDKNGAYTTGTKSLDNYLYDFLKDILAGYNYTAKWKVDSSGTKTVYASTQREKLYAAYCKMRDYCWDYKRYAREAEWDYPTAALMFLQNHKGDCAGFGAAMAYVAQRVGYDCRIAEGKLETGAVHVWEVIHFPGGSVKAMDVEQEWGFIDGYYGSSGGNVYYDCYLMDYSDGADLYYGSRYNNPKHNGWSPYYEF